MIPTNIPPFPSPTFVSTSTSPSTLLSDLSHTPTRLVAFPISKAVAVVSRLRQKSTYNLFFFSSNQPRRHLIPPNPVTPTFLIAFLIGDLSRFISRRETFHHHSIDSFLFCNIYPRFHFQLTLFWHLFDADRVTDPSVTPTPSHEVHTLKRRSLSPSIPLTVARQAGVLLSPLPHLQPTSVRPRL